MGAGARERKGERTGGGEGCRKGGRVRGGAKHGELRFQSRTGWSRAFLGCELD